MVVKLRRWPVFILLLALAAAGAFGVWKAAGLLYRSSYPQSYKEPLAAAAARYGVEPNMLFALVKTESGFRPDATSNVGARGLCQIMNDTFEWVRGKVGGDAVFDDMYDPAQNLAYGAFLLSYLYREFGSYETALAAYHAGRGAVAGWLRDERYSSDGKTLTRIPITDTAHYVGKVIQAYKTYEKLYPDSG